jgi:Primase C terminal 2 (PriCT-2)
VHFGRVRLGRQFVAHWAVVNASLGETLRKNFDDWSQRWPEKFNEADQEAQWRDWVQRAADRKQSGESLRGYGSLVAMAGGREKWPEPLLLPKQPGEPIVLADSKGVSLTASLPLSASSSPNDDEGEEQHSKKPSHASS